MIFFKNLDCKRSLSYQAYNLDLAPSNFQSTLSHFIKTTTAIVILGNAFATHGFSMNLASHNSTRFTLSQSIKHIRVLSGLWIFKFGNCFPQIICISIQRAIYVSLYHYVQTFIIKTYFDSNSCSVHYLGPNTTISPLYLHASIKISMQN